MSNSLSLVKIKPEQPKRAFFRKILRRRHSQSLANTSLSTTGSLDTPSSPKSNASNLLASTTTSDRTFIDNGPILYDHEGDNLDILLNPDADVFSTSEFLALNDKISRAPNSPLFQDNERLGEESVWADLTYEALEQPKYYKPLRKGKKSPKLLNNIFLAQELRCLHPETYESDSASETERAYAVENKRDTSFSALNPEEILVMEFSRDGKYLAVAGRDKRITVWQVISSPLSKLEFRNKEATLKSSKKRNSKLRLFRAAPVFLQEPVRVFEGHTNTVLCLDWSKNNFLVSGSMDKTVKLWNVDRAECLESFDHTDFVTSVKFHPNDDRFFISGALDDSVQLWSILDRSVAFSRSFGDSVLITALAFTPSGDNCIVGAFDGSLYILETHGLRLAYRVDVKERSVPNPFHSRDDRKITGISVFENPEIGDKADTELGKYHILVTTNDSNVRLINLNLNKLMTRFKGSHNDGSSVVAAMTDDNNYIISGSEDSNFYVWKNDHSIINNKIRASLKEIYEDGIDTLAQKQDKLAKIIPESTGWKKILSLDEGNGKHFISNENNSYASVHAHNSRCNAAIFAPERTKRLLEFSDDLIYDLVRRRDLLEGQNNVINLTKDCKETSQIEELKRGEIIITCDSTGLIRVFRQDSAYYARKTITEAFKSLKRDDRGENSDTNSLTPSKSSYRAEISKCLSSTRSSSPSQDIGSSLKMKLQSKINVNPTRSSTNNNYLSLLPFPSIEQALAGHLATEPRSLLTRGKLNGSMTSLASPNSSHIRTNGRGRSISASEYTRGRASSLLSSSTALSSTESLLIRNQDTT